MNAHYIIKTADRLSNYHRKLIVHLATNEDDDLQQRVKRLRKLSFCTDDVKFDVLHDNISGKLYDDLYNLYFGTVQDEEEQATVNEGQHHKQPIHWTDELTVQLIEAYNSGLRGVDLADKMGMDLIAVNNRLQRIKAKPKFKEFRRMLNMNQTTTQTANTEPAETEAKTAKAEAPTAKAEAPTAKTEAPTAKTEAPTPDRLPKSFSAYGSGFITTEGGLKLDEEPILTAIRQAIMEKGLRQFYGEVAVTITPKEPTGMTVTVEE